ncbi:uncharacterized protein JCM6883_000971 [Sporobolomyces salmoneus]|uniref:uncharacterized protein n=1 Tax=Sporobolomyces salmoneus TaxID=183962 RepID=UPI00317D15BE
MPSHSLLSALLTTRRGIFFLSLSFLTLYLLFHSSSSSSTLTTTTPSTNTPGGGVKGWAREYWNKASWSSTSVREEEEERESLGNLRELKEAKHRKMREEELARGGILGGGNEHAFEREGEREGEGTKQEWKKVEESNDLFATKVDQYQEEEETERFINSDSEENDEYLPGIEYEEGTGRGGDQGSGSALFNHNHNVDPKEAALADSPRVAIEEEALNRAPMAALPSTEEESSANSGGSNPNDGTTGLADHAAAKAPSQEKEKGNNNNNEDTGPQHQILRKPKPKPKPNVVAGKPKKIGTGGKVVKPEEVLAPVVEGGGSGHAAKGVGVEGGGEKAGKVVQAEAGKRVGTGARPGAKGMGLERLEGIGAERRRVRRRRIEWR